MNRKIVIEMSIINEEETNKRVNFIHFVEGEDICEVAGKINKFIMENIELQKGEIMNETDY